MSPISLEAFQAEFLPLPPALVPILEAWLPSAAPGPWLVPGVRRVGPWTGGSPGSRAIDALKRACHAAGVPPVTWHGLRHTYASNAMLHFGLPLWAVQRILGHTDSRTTQRYLHLDQVEALIEAASSIDYRRLA